MWVQSDVWVHLLHQTLTSRRYSIRLSISLPFLLLRDGLAGFFIPSGQQHQGVDKRRYELSHDSSPNQTDSSPCCDRPGPQRGRTGLESPL